MLHDASDCLAWLTADVADFFTKDFWHYLNDMLEYQAYSDLSELKLFESYLYVAMKQLIILIGLCALWRDCENVLK